MPDPNVENMAMFNSLTRVDHLMTKGTYTGLMLTGDFNHSTTSWDDLGFPTTSKTSETSFTYFVRSYVGSMLAFQPFKCLLLRLN